MTDRLERIAARAGGLWPLLLTTTAVAALATAFITLVPAVSFAYRSPSLHSAIESTATTVGLLAALIVLGRYRRSGSLSSLLLVVALALLALTNLFFSNLPAFGGDGESAFETWSPVAGRLVGAIALAAAALAPDRELRHPARALRVAALAVALVLAAIAVGAALLSSSLPVGIDPDLSPESSSRPRVVGEPALLAIQIVGMALLAGAAFGFARRAERTGDELMAWLAAAAVLGAFARLNYFLFPSLYSEWVYTGDFLRLGFYLLLFAGSARQIVLYQRQAAEAAALDERRRLARDIHDGVAQDLAFIVGQARRLTARGDDAAGLISHAAEHALDESREAISSLMGQPDETLDATVARAAEQVAGRAGARLELDLEEVPAAPATRQALSRITREAISNAVRHGDAGTISVCLVADGELRLTVSDDGRGFDPEIVDGSGHGLVSMRERARELGGELRIDSSPDGTLVELRVP